MSPGDAKAIKGEMRERIWSEMERLGIARFPRPVYGRIPNFVGAEEAARKLANSKEFMDSRLIKVNPDQPQWRVRHLALIHGKELLVPSPRLREGFLLLKASRIPKGRLREASSIRGAFSLGQPIHPSSLSKVDLIVVGSVAVSRKGGRLGKGEGYGELEYAMLRECRVVGEETPVFTTVHDVQVVEELPIEPHDLCVDRIYTPSSIIYIEPRLNKPKGLIWEMITQDMLDRIPILRSFKG